MDRFEGYSDMSGIEELRQRVTDAEERFGLNDEQRAFRRFKYFLGSIRSRRKAKRENPEYPEMAFESPENTYFDPAARPMGIRSKCYSLWSIFNSRAGEEQASALAEGRMRRGLWPLPVQSRQINR